MLMVEGRSSYIDKLRTDINKNYNKINILDFDFYDTSVFNECENSNNLLMAVKGWKNVHPFIKIIPVEWAHTISFGLLYSSEPSEIFNYLFI